MGVDASAVARVLGIETAFKDLRAGGVLFLPQRIAVFAQGATASNATYSTTKQQVTSAADVANTYGFGSPLHLIVRELLPSNGDGVGSIPVTVYPLKDDAGGVAAAGDITPGGTATKQTTLRVRIGGIVSNAFTIPAGAVNVATTIASMVAAINAALDMPAIAADGTTDVDVTAKWKGISGNDLRIEILGDLNGVTFAITQPTGGATDAALTDALAQVGDVWETMAINGLGTTAAIDALATFGEGRWSPLIRKPLVAFTGSGKGIDTSERNALLAIASARKTDRVNSLIAAPGSPHHPAVIAARAVARIARLANNNPPVNYSLQRLSALEPGLDSVQWDHTTRDQMVKGGISATVVQDGIIKLSDIITFYRPDGEEPPAYRYVVDIVKLQNVIFNLNLIFSSAEWAGAPLIPDDQPTVNPAARKPKTAKSFVSAMLDSLGLNAIISDPEAAKQSVTATISPSNPKRLDVALLVQLGGNAEIISVDLNFGFFFGAAAAA